MIKMKIQRKMSFPSYPEEFIGCGRTRGNIFLIKVPSSPIEENDEKYDKKNIICYGFNELGHVKS